MQFGVGILIKRAMSKGGVHKLQIFCREKYIDFCSKNLQPKRSLNARLGHSKLGNYLTVKAPHDKRGPPALKLYSS